MRGAAMLAAVPQARHSAEPPRHHSLSRNNPGPRYNSGHFSKSRLSSPNSSLRLNRNHSINSPSLGLLQGSGSNTTRGW